MAAPRFFHRPNLSIMKNEQTTQNSQTQTSSDDPNIQNSPSASGLHIQVQSRRGKRKERHVSFCHEMWYHFCWSIAWFVLKFGFRVRYRGCRNVPGKGPVLVVANHQSYLDPPAIGAGIWRRMNYLARKELFTFKPFALLIASVDAIPLDQNGIGFQGIKETMRRLRNKEMVLIFPEGKRSDDGQMTPFMKGYVNMAVKTGAVIVPAAIIGAFEAFPRQKKFPSIFKPAIRVEYGKGIAPEDYSGMKEEDLHNLVERRVMEIFQKLSQEKKR